jgi:hypothetical protein
MAQLAGCRLSRTGFVPWPVPHRPATQRRVAEHRHMPSRGARPLLGRPCRAAVAQHPGHRDQAWAPLVPILAALRDQLPLAVAPELGALDEVGLLAIACARSLPSKSCGALWSVTVWTSPVRVSYNRTGGQTLHAR